MREAVWRVVRAGLIGVAVGALAVEIAAFALDGRWPPHPVAHVAAVAFALLLGYATATTVMLVEGVRGLGAAVSQLDDVARASAETGLNVLDAMVDAVDGPNRHGFRGQREPTVPPIPPIPPIPAIPVAPAAYPPSSPLWHDGASAASYPRGFPTWQGTARSEVNSVRR
jgi:hypothetical protein